MLTVQREPKVSSLEMQLRESVGIVVMHTEIQVQSESHSTIYNRTTVISDAHKGYRQRDRNKYQQEQKKRLCVTEAPSSVTVLSASCWAAK